VITIIKVETSRSDCFKGPHPPSFCFEHRFNVTALLEDGEFKSLSGVTGEFEVFIKEGAVPVIVLA
jgi:hypothetical protein